MEKIKLSKWWPADLLQNCYQSISYQDTHLDNDIDNIKTLLNEGYNVMAYLNYGFSNPSSNRNTLFIHKTFYPFLAEPKDIDIYFLNLDGIENYSISSLEYPEPVLCSIYSYNEVLDHLPQNEHSILSAITEFFGYLSYETV